jgi:hypothetical protein
LLLSSTGAHFRNASRAWADDDDDVEEGARGAIEEITAAAEDTQPASAVTLAFENPMLQQQEEVEVNAFGNLESVDEAESGAGDVEEPKSASLD